MKNRKLILALIGLLIILMVLVLIDLGTGIFYWNRENLNFDATNYNNIVTPTATVLAFGVYTITLIYLIRQTKIIHSQNMKPFFEAKLKVLMSKGENVVIEYKENNTVTKYNALNYIVGLNNLFGLLEYDSDFQNDTNEIVQKQYKPSDIENKSYYDRLSIIFEVIKYKSPLLDFYQDIKRFLEDIETSTMTNEDKILFRKEVADILLKDYIDFINSLDNNRFNPVIPILYTTDNSDYVEFKQLNKTRFRECYDIFKM